MKKIFIKALLCMFVLLSLSCYKITSSFKRVIYSGHLNAPVDPRDLKRGASTDYRVFQRTPVWDLAFALAVGDLGEVEELAIKHKKIIDTTEPKTGCTLLTYAIRNNQLDAVKILLENGANPNATTLGRYTQTSIHAAVASSPRMLKLILENGGNPNLNADVDYKITKDMWFDEPMAFKGGFSPLKYAEDTNILKILVEAGGDIKIKNQYGGSLLLEENIRHDRLTNILYLLEQGADYQGILGYSAGFNYGKPKEELVPLYLVDRLRFKVYGLQSDWYREKMDIVRFLEKKGINYWTTQIPYNTKIDIDRLSERNRWSEKQKQEFLEKY